MRDALGFLGLIAVLIVGYVLWGVFFYAPLIGDGWTIGLVAFSLFCLVIGWMSAPRY